MFSRSALQFSQRSHISVCLLYGLAWSLSSWFYLLCRRERLFLTCGICCILPFFFQLFEQSTAVVLCVAFWIELQCHHCGDG
eukprot:m.66635 g.66635  ORF g.66635 m.66635 type:complete len:82 (-) comp18112_c0_seq3:1551-1796(-)